jgi:signal transduction histidine kinase
LRVVDVTLGLVVLAGAFARIADGERWTIVPPASAVELLIFVAAAAATAARSFPVPALAVAASLDAAQHWLPLGQAGIHISFMICTYMVAAHGPRRTWPVAVAAVLVSQTVFMSWSLDWWWGHAFVMVAGMSALLPAALGVAARSRRAAVLALQARAEEAERSRQSEARQLLVEDRLRVARDLHDSVAHQIAVMNLNTAVASSALPDRPQDAEQALVTVRAAGRSVIDSIGDLLSGLREDEWDDHEARFPVSELHRLTEEFRALMPLVDLELGESVALSQTIDAVPFLVIREGLTNAYKHGDHEKSVTLEVSRDSRAYSLRVVNTSGRTTSAFVEGFGLRGMRERVLARGGHLDVSCTGRTFVVSAEIPSDTEAS